MVAKPVVRRTEGAVILFSFISVYSPSNELKIKSLFSGEALERQHSRSMRVLLRRETRYLLPNKPKQLTHAQFINRRIISLYISAGSGLFCHQSKHTRGVTISFYIFDFFLN